MILPGNPRGVAPRTVYLYPGQDGRKPEVVVKSGTPPAARALIRRECALMRQVSPRGLAPRVLEEIENEDYSAFAMEFVGGQSPSWPASPKQIAESLSKMVVEGDRLLPIAETAAWKALTPHLSESSRRQFEDFAQRTIPRCLLHGDFAPWNLRVTSENTWMALDWEYGELTGVPGWDWLHFLVLSARLLGKMSDEEVRGLLHQEMRTREFQDYLEKVGLRGCEDMIVSSYFEYLEHIFRPTV